MSDPTVTVIAAFYNRADYVHESLESILNQSFEDLELIVFDDHSTDATFDNLRSLADKDERVRVFRNEQNLGFVRSMNRHLKKARGRYIAVHGSGDISHCERIAQQYKFLEENEEVQVVSCRVQRVSSDGKVHLPDKGSGKVTHQDLMEKNRFYHGEVMYRRSLFEKLGGYREIFRVGSDYDLWLRMTKFGPGYILPEVLYTVQSPHNGLSRDLRNRVDQKIVVGYARKLAQEDIDVQSATDLHGIELKGDQRLREDLHKVFASSIKRGQMNAVRYSSKRYKEIFGESILKGIVRKRVGRIA